MQELSLLFSSTSWSVLDDPDRDRDTQRTKLKTKKCDMSKNYHCALEKRQGSNCSNMDGCYTAKNATVLLQVVNRLVATSQQVSTNLPIFSSCNTSVQIRLAAACHLQTCYNLLKQLAASLWITSFRKQLSQSSLLITCNRRLVFNNLLQSRQTRPDIGFCVSGCVTY